MGHRARDKLTIVSTKQWAHRAVSPDSGEPSTKSRSLRARSIPSTAEVPYYTFRQQPTIACQAAEPQRLPYSGPLQRSQGFHSHREQLQSRQDIQRKQHDSRSIRELRKLNQGEQVTMFQPRTKTCTPAEVKEETSEPRSYIIRTTDGSQLRRNRVQLKPLGKTPAACGDQLASNQESLPVHRDAPKPLPSQLSSPELPQVPVQVPVSVTF